VAEGRRVVHRQPPLGIVAFAAIEGEVPVPFVVSVLAAKGDRGERQDCADDEDQTSHEWTPVSVARQVGSTGSDEAAPSNPALRTAMLPSVVVAKPLGPDGAVGRRGPSA
jgi:hypothetical protein